MFGLELHPAVIHFPIALGVVGAVASIAYLFVRKEWLRWFGPILLTCALLGSGVAYFSGQSAEDRAEDLKVPKAAIEEHEESAIWAIGLVALATLLSWATVSKRRGEWLAALIAAVAAAAFLRTGHLGGVLVFVHGAGHVTPKTAASPAVPGGGGEHGEKGDGDHD